MSGRRFPMFETAPSLSTFVGTLRRREPLCIVKFNDGELHAMVGRGGRNCDMHAYGHRMLGMELRRAYAYLKQFAWISDYIEITPYDDHRRWRDANGWPARTFPHYALLHTQDTTTTPDSLVPELREFYDTIRMDTRHKILVAPDRLFVANEFLDYRGELECIRVPMRDAYLHYARIKWPLMAALRRHPDAIVMTCCGFVANLLARETCMTFKRATFIDIGSGLDNLFAGISRGNQYGLEDARKFHSSSFNRWPKIRDWSQEIQGYFGFADVYDAMVERFGDGSQFVEVGTYRGKSACYLATAIRNSGKRITLDTIDHFRWNPTDKPYNTALAARVNLGIARGYLRAHWQTCRNGCEQTRVDNVLRIVQRASYAASKTYGDKSLDFVFIDAAGTHTEATAMIRNWLPKIRAGGVIAMNGFARVASEQLGEITEYGNAWTHEVTE